MDPSTDISRKRRRVTDQIKEGIISEMTYDSVLPLSGTIQIKCPSRDRFNTHTITIFVNDGNKLNFACDCEGGTSESLSGHCIHLNTAMIHMCKEFINESVKFMEYKEKYIQLKQKVNELGDLMGDLKV